jgi:hypothetical protein
MTRSRKRGKNFIGGFKTIEKFEAHIAKNYHKKPVAKPDEYFGGGYHFMYVGRTLTRNKDFRAEACYAGFGKSYNETKYDAVVFTPFFYREGWNGWLYNNWFMDRKNSPYRLLLEEVYKYFKWKSWKAFSEWTERFGLIIPNKVLNKFSAAYVASAGITYRQGKYGIIEQIQKLSEKHPTVPITYVFYMGQNIYDHENHNHSIMAHGGQGALRPEVYREGFVIPPMFTPS